MRVIVVSLIYDLWLECCTNIFRGYDALSSCLPLQSKKKDVFTIVRGRSLTLDGRQVLIARIRTVCKTDAEARVSREE